jgi:hypothetical protein
MERTIIKWIYPRKLLKKDTEKTYEKVLTPLTDNAPLLRKPSPPTIPFPITPFLSSLLRQDIPKETAKKGH